MDGYSIEALHTYVVEYLCNTQSVDLGHPQFALEVSQKGKFADSKSRKHSNKL